MRSALLNENPSHFGIGAGTISFIEGCYLIIKPTLSFNVGIYKLESGLASFDSDSCYQFIIPQAPWAITYLRLGLAPVNIESN
jgi:hypothetical protein